MNIAKNLYKKWKNPAIKYSIVYAVPTFICIILFNYFYSVQYDNSLDDFLFDVSVGIFLALISAIVIYSLLKTNLEKIRVINNERDDILKKLKLQFLKMPMGIVTLDNDFKITDWNPAAEKIFGYSRDEVIGRNTCDVIVHKDFKNELERIVKEVKKNNSSVENTHENITKSGKIIICQWSTIPLFDNDNNYIGLMGMVNDITEKTKNKEELKKLLSAVEQNPASIVITSINGFLEYANPITSEITGYSKEELIGQSPEDMFHSEFVTQETRKDIHNHIFSAKTWKGELLNKKKSGELYWADVTIVPVLNYNDEVTHFVGIEEDITEKKHIHEQLRHSLEEKELMLKEIHHRVKNNLQVVSSLLSLQASQIEDKTAMESFNVSRDRIKSMSLVHEKLYRNDLANIDFGNYIDTLGQQLLNSYGEVNGRIKINTNAEGISFAIDTAIPLGLIINELMVNSIKHAFPCNIKGEICISIESIAKGNYILIISDNGIGLPDDFESRVIKSIGMQLVEALVAQLEGKLTLNNNSGGEFIIEFEETVYKKRFSAENTIIENNLSLVNNY